MTRPTRLRQCAILAGGLGNRLGALTATTPKPVLPVGGRPFLAWLIRELSRYGIEEVLLLSGHSSDRVQDEVRTFNALLPRPVAIEFSGEAASAGTGGALLQAAAHLDARFLLCNGESLLAGNLAPVLAAAARDPDEVLARLVVRHSADASLCGVVECDGEIVTHYHEPRPPGTSDGLTNAGIYVVDRRILAELQPICSLERDVLPRLAAKGRLRASRSEGGFIDIGSPADDARTQTLLRDALHRPALFLDRDGVLNHDHGHVGTRERFDWIDGAIEAVRLATATGWHVFIATNQSGVARGFYGEDDVRALLAWIQGECLAAGGTIDDVRYCPFHPEAALPEFRRSSDWRKPAPGMLNDLIRAWELDPSRCIMVGDQETDMQAAARAGIAGHRFTGGNLARFVAPLLACPLLA